jgi:hypothetical protein
MEPDWEAESPPRDCVRLAADGRAFGADAPLGRETPRPAIQLSRPPGLNVLDRCLIPRCHRVET